MELDENLYSSIFLPVKIIVKSVKTMSKNIERGNTLLFLVVNPNFPQL